MKNETLIIGTTDKLKLENNDLHAKIAELEWENKWRKRDTEHLMELGAQYKELTATNDRQALMIYAKDRQIAELTRMLFALGKQDGQTIRAQAAEIERLTEKVRYAYVQIEALERVK